MYTPKTLIWNDTLTTGDKELDAQHKYLFDIFNDLGRAIERGLGAKVVTMVLDVLKYYAEWHFNKEENCMERYRCPIAGKNKKAHSAFIKKFNEYQKEYETTDASNELAIKIHEYLSEWIMGHILVVDGELYPCIHGKPKPGKETPSPPPLW
jgi:hemerythrin